MKTVELTITRIGNSKGIRIPADILRRYKLQKTVLLEERADELALRPSKKTKLSWKETYAEMATAKETWSEWDGVASDDFHDF